MDYFLSPVLRLLKFFTALKDDVVDDNACPKHTAFGIVIAILIFCSITVLIFGIILKSMFLMYLALAIPSSLALDILIKVFFGQYWIYEKQILFFETKIISRRNNIQNGTRKNQK